MPYNDNIMNHQLVTLSNTVATRLTPLGNVHSGLDITVQNVNSEGYVYLGGANTVSSANYGYRISPDNAFSVELGGYDHLYAIASSNNLPVAILIGSLESGS
ncbi:hypothetical protein UFOVP828_110 [uncultured Caudovirales phage]|uniref:Uncharacterized protein n=1 Tax=uncultured Caudovirales phage TaxID=2100421 RepID=A0A6J5P460_9CAUD|nr:hypothetical protein UFOVP828_110 [uncultured Caudovirales phage]